MSKGICAVSISPAIDKTIYITDFKTNKVNRVEKSFDLPGSKGVNVALNLATCGIKSTCAGFIGGAGSDFILSELSRGGVKCDFVPVKYDVRTNLKVVDLNQKTYTDINFPSGEPDFENIDTLKEKLKKLAHENDFIALSGNISSPSLSKLYGEITDIIKKENAAKVTIDCTGDALLFACEKKPYAIKPNLSEFNETFSVNCKTRDDIKNAALKLSESGIENILVSLDKDGAVAVLNKAAYFVYNCDLPVYNTVGAGDAFLSGFLYAKCKGFDDVTTLKYASSFAQATVSKKAEDKKTLDEYVKYVSSIRVEEI